MKNEMIFLFSYLNQKNTHTRTHTLWSFYAYLLCIGPNAINPWWLHAFCLKILVYFVYLFKINSVFSLKGYNAFLLSSVGSHILAFLILFEWCTTCILIKVHTVLERHHKLAAVHKTCLIVHSLWSRHSLSVCVRLYLYPIRSSVGWLLIVVSFARPAVENVRMECLQR